MSEDNPTRLFEWFVQGIRAGHEPSAPVAYSFTTNVESAAAAKEQLETAIALYFLGVSRCSVHSLVGGAQEIFRALSRKNARTQRGGSLPVGLLDQLSATDVMETDAWNDVRNALKHWQPNTTEKTLDDIQNLIWIADAILNMDARAVGDKTGLIRLFILWSVAAINDFSLAVPKELREQLPHSEERRGLASIAPQSEWAHTTLKDLPQLPVPLWFKAALTSVVEAA